MVMELEIHEPYKLEEHLQRAMEKDTGSFYCQDLFVSNGLTVCMRLMYFTFHINFNEYW